jgi:hypothetical protein
LHEAAGKYFMWLADDDWIDPNYVSSCVRMLLNDPEATLAGGSAQYYAGDVLVSVELMPELTHSSSARRVIGYYAHVVMNGGFYGISRTDTRRSVALQDSHAADWVHMAELAALGNIRSAPTIIYRSKGGASLSIPQGWRNFAIPTATIVAREVAHYRSFGEASAFARKGIGLICGGIVAWRFGVLRWRDLVAGLVVRTLAPKLTTQRYSQVRYVYHRLTLQREKVRTIRALSQSSDDLRG